MNLKLEISGSGSSVFSPQFKNLKKNRIQLEKLLKSNNVWLFCDPLDYIPPDSSVHGILQARLLEWVAISFSRGSSWTRDRTQISCIAGGFFTTELPKNPIQIQPSSSVPCWKQGARAPLPQVHIGGYTAWGVREGPADTYTLLSQEELMTVASPGKSKQDDKAWNTSDSPLIIYKN